MKLALAVLALITTVAPLLLAESASAFRSNPPNGHTGAPIAAGGNEFTCARSGCHNSFALNSGPGSVAITGIDEYVPGGVHLITVTVVHDGRIRFGFQMTALDDQLEGVGTFSAGEGSQIQSSGSREYAEHTFAGTEGGNPWTVNWTAPENHSGEISFYAVGNATNSNGAASLDRIYSTSITVPEPAPGSLALAAITTLIGLARFRRPTPRSQAQ